MHRLITTTWLCVLGVMLSRQDCYAGSGLTFTASPYTAGLTKSVRMHCGVAASVPIAHVSSMIITYGSVHQYVASVTANQAAKAFKTQGNLRVTGSVAGRGRLDLTWDMPSQMPTGAYTCEVTFRSTSNQRKRLVGAVRITSATPSNRELAQFIAKMRACISPKVSFIARPKSWNPTYQSGQIVKYDNILENINGNYDPSTSIFTCQEPGIYQFDVHAISQYNKYACLQLQRNGKPMTALYADASSNSSASTSAVFKLKAGDKVKVNASCTSHIYTRGLRNYFSGVLLHSEKCGL